MATHPDIIIAIIAGGKSSRMGLDKPMLRWRGLSLLENIVQESLKTGFNTIVCGREQPEGWHMDQTPFIKDEIVGQGPIGGIASALTFAKSASVVALASDMPLVDRKTIGWLIEQFASTAAVSGLITRTDAGIEPLFSVYTSQSLPIVRHCLSAGHRSLRHVIENGEFTVIEAPKRVASALINVNTPEDWAEVQSTQIIRPN